MRKATVVLALLVLAAAPMAKAGAASPGQAGIISNEAPDNADRSKQTACDCCQKCKAAKGAIKSRHQDDVLESDGCDDCCAKCGKTLQPSQQETPPEIIEKHTPPDIIEKNEE